MKIIKLIIIAFFISLFQMNAQENAYDEKMNMQIVGPSPTNAALIIHDKIPVDESTGIPNIQIPLFSSKTIDKELDINIALKYHPYQVMAETVAGSTGLGWGLNAGGVITRTMKGFPDEIITRNIDPGILCYNFFRDGIKRYDTYENVDAQMNEDYIKYLYNSGKGFNDNEYDIFNLNINGISEEFILNRIDDDEGPKLITKLLNPTNNIINVNYIYDFQTDSFDIISFDLIDVNGNKYVFNEIEEVYSSKDIINEYYNTDHNNFSSTMPTNWKSAFKISSIINSNNKIIVEYFYENDFEYNPTTSFVNNIYEPNIHLESSYTNPSEMYIFFPPTFSQTTTHNYYYTKLLKRIKILNKSEIYFNHDTSREDRSNYHNKTLLKEILIKNSFNEVLKKFELKYTYANNKYYNVKTKKLLLQSLIDVNLNEINNNINYLFYYNLIDENINLYSDFWGFYNNNEKRLPDYINDFSSTNILKQITHPGNYVQLFDYELNDFSFILNNKIDNETILNNNFNNFDITTKEEINITGSGTRRLIISFDLFRNDVELNYFTVENQDPNTSNFYILENNIRLTPIGGKYFITNPNSNYQLVVQSSLIGDNKNTSRLIINYYYKKIVLESNKIYGGGIRIKQIDQNNLKTKYEYKIFNLSSGSLANYLPIESYSEYIACLSIKRLGLGVQFSPFEIFVNTKTYSNLHNNELLNGSFVKYNKVKVINPDFSFEEKYFDEEYSSEIHYAHSTYPFISNKNKAYKSNLLKKSKIFNSNNILLTETNFNYYYFNEQNLQIGKKVYYINSDISTALFKYTNNYLNYNDYNHYNFGNLNLNNGVKLYKEMYYSGKANLLSKTTTEYFENKKIETTNIYGYNAKNQLISENINQSTFIVDNGLSLSQNIITKNFKYSNLNTNNYTSNIINNVEEIKTTTNGNTVIKKINYANSNSNQTYLPTNLEFTKGNSSSFIQAKFNSYDEFNNVLETQQNEDGLKTSYIYGYNKSLPVVKLENVTYASIDASLIQQIQNTTNEDELLSLFNTLRNNHPQGLITTYTHIPLVGISKVIDPNGKVINYYYDEFNRLSRVTDSENNPVTDYQYHYKTL